MEKDEKGHARWKEDPARFLDDCVYAIVKKYRVILDAAAIEAIAAHWDVCSARCSNTIRTARSRTSAENLWDVL